MKRLTILATAAILTGAAAYAAGDVNAQFRTWDTNDDGMINITEFYRGIAQIDAFDAMDANRDGMIDRDEFSEGTWKQYDSDNDGMWSQTEAGVWDDSRIRSGGEKSQ